MTTEEMNRRRALLATCPTCAAAPGNKCVDMRMAPAYRIQNPHAEIVRVHPDRVVAGVRDVQARIARRVAA